MTGKNSQRKTSSSRRAFFVSGGAVLGAGVATAVGASAVAPGSAMPFEEQLTRLREQLAGLEDRQAIRELHLAFAAFIEQQRYEAAAELFDERAHLDLSGVSATGKAEIAQLLANQYRDQNAPSIHNAYRQNTSQQKDVITLGDDRLHAAATFHMEVELCTPLQSDCTVATMARLQGNVADRRWEAGRFEGQYVKTRGMWRIESLTCLTA